MLLTLDVYLCLYTYVHITYLTIIIKKIILKIEKKHPNNLLLIIIRTKNKHNIY